jgi:hypothetical protein
MPLPLAGGSRGAAMLAILALAGTLVPWKFGALFLDRAILLAYTGVAILLASNSSVRALAGCRDAAHLRPAALSAALSGWLGWAIVLGASFAALAYWRGRLTLPPAATLFALAALAAAAAWLAAALAAVAALNVHSVKAASDLMRLGFFFLLLVTVMGPRFLPPDWQRELSRTITGARFVPTLLACAACFVPAGFALLRHARTVIAGHAVKLSITES